MSTIENNIIDKVETEQSVAVNDFPIIKDNMNMSNIKNIMLIDKTIENSGIFFDSNNNETLPIEYYCYTDREKIYDYLQNHFISIDRICIVFDNSMMNDKYLFNSENFFTEQDIIQFENNEINLDNYSNNVNFFIKIVKQFNIKRLDFLACKSLQYNNWSKYYSLLEKFTSVIIGASNDLTGNINYGGDWVMENTNDDIKNIYFNETITNYNSTLASSSIGYINTATTGAYNVLLFILKPKTTLTLTNFSNLIFNTGITDAQKVYDVYCREKSIGAFTKALSLTNLGFKLTQNKDYEILLVFLGTSTLTTYYYYTNTYPSNVTTALVDGTQLTMYPSKGYYNSALSALSNFVLNTGYNSVNSSTNYRRQVLTLNYTYQYAVVLTNFNNIIKTFGDTAFTIVQPGTTSTGSFSYTSSDTTVATISGTTVTIVGAGLATIRVEQAETTDYAYVSTTCTLTVNKANPVLTNFANLTKTFGDAAFTIGAPSSNNTESGGTFSYTSSDTSVATISGTTVTIVGAGLATITATQAATTNYNLGTTTCTLTVNKATPILSNFNAITKTFGDAAFTIGAPSSNNTESGGTFSYTSSDTSVATISGTTVTIVGAGLATITATQAATTNYNLGTTTCTLTVNKATPILSNFNAITKTFGDADFTIETTSNSTGSFSYTSSDTSIATISASTVSILKVGSITITATQSATTNYNSGTTTCTLTVSKTDAAILKAAGYTAPALKDGGYTAIQLEMGGYVLTDINNLNYTNAEVETSGELIYALNTSALNKPIVLTGDIDLRQVPSNLYSNSVKQISASKEIKIYF